MFDAGTIAKLGAFGESAERDLVEFAQRIIRTPSMSGDEKACVDVIVGEMKALGYDEAYVDGVGNAIGVIRGSCPDLPPVLLNSHVDHVDPGDPGAWPHPPYGGVVEGDALFGRGASDTKGAIAVQVYAPGILKKQGLRPWRDTYVAAVVLEETSGLGTRWLIEHGGLPSFAVAYLGEATANNLCIGHRGRAELRVRVDGRAAHASAPERGDNPLYGIARVLLGLRDLAENQAAHHILGRSTIAPTQVRTSSVSPNAISDWCEAVVDWRYTRETPEEMIQALERIMKDAAVKGEAGFMMQNAVSYLGVSDSRPHLAHSYVLEPDSAEVRRVVNVLHAVMGRVPSIGTWRFCTDGGYLASVAKIPTIGFSPCEERYAHTSDDQVSISLMREGLVGYMALLVSQ